MPGANADTHSFDTLRKKQGRRRNLCWIAEHTSFNVESLHQDFNICRERRRFRSLPTCAASIHHGRATFTPVRLNPRLMFNAMKTKIHNTFRLCILPVLLSLTAPFAAADVLHVTTGISIAPGNTGVLNWNVDEEEDGNTSIEFVFSYDSFGLGSRLVNSSENGSAPPVPGSLLTRNGKLANLPAFFLIDESPPDDLAWTEVIEPLTTAPEPLFGLDGFTEDTPGYIGFSFQRSGTTLYGWAKLTITTGVDTGGDPLVPGLTISEWAYDTLGNPIAVPVPEPCMTAVLTLGTCGLALRQRRQRKQRSATP